MIDPHFTRTNTTSTQLTYTKVPNQLLESLPLYDLTPTQVSLLLTLIRETFGWHRDTVKLPLEKWAAKACLDKSHANKAINLLIEQGVIARIKSQVQFLPVGQWRVPLKDRVLKERKRLPTPIFYIENEQLRPISYTYIMGEPAIHPVANSAIHPVANSATNPVANSATNPVANSASNHIEIIEELEEKKEKKEKERTTTTANCLPGQIMPCCTCGGFSSQSFHEATPPPPIHESPLSPTVENFHGPTGPTINPYLDDILKAEASIRNKHLDETIGRELEAIISGIQPQPANIHNGSTVVESPVMPIHNGSTVVESPVMPIHNGSTVVESPKIQRSPNSLTELLHKNLNERDGRAILGRLRSIDDIPAKEVLEELYARMDGDGEPIRNPVGFVRVLVENVLAGTFSPAAGARRKNKQDLEERRRLANKKSIEAKRRQKVEDEKEETEKQALLANILAILTPEIFEAEKKVFMESLPWGSLARDMINQSGFDSIFGQVYWQAYLIQKFSGYKINALP